MARPRLNSVDYFPHFVNWGKTIPILEARFGNDGYAVWFKLLESLGRANGHYIDCADANEWEFLLSKFRVSDETALEILNKLADLGAIDRDLWTMEKVIWSDNFVCHLEYLYKKRREDAPKRPNIRSFRDGNPTCDVVSDAETPQSIAQHSIAEERKEEKETFADEMEPEPDDSPTFVSFPVKGSGTFPVTEKLIEEYQDLYPTLNVRDLVRDMYAWLVSNPAKQKTKRGSRAFINNWLTNAKAKAPTKQQADIYHRFD